MNLGIGQGDMGVTPLQLTRYIATVANKGTLLPPHLALSVNYPPLSPSEIQGVSVNRLGVSSDRQLTYVEIAPGLFSPKFVPAPTEQEVPSSDRESYDAGFITIVPLDGDYTARSNRFIALINPEAM